MAYALIKPFLAEDTAAKVDVYSDAWQNYLLRDISESELPAHWAGVKRDPVDGDPRCPSLVCPGGEVPCSFYTAPVSLESRDLCVINFDPLSFVAVTSSVHRSKLGGDNSGQAII